MKQDVKKSEPERSVTTGEARAMEPERTRGQVFVPATDIYELEKELVVVMDLPGADSESIEVRQEEGVLTVTADAADAFPEGKECLHAEYRPGCYERSFRLTEAVDSAAIKAAYKQGVLTLRLPKSEALQPRRIPVEAAS